MKIAVIDDERPARKMLIRRVKEVRPDRLDRELGDMFRLPYENNAASCGATLVDEQHHQERSSRALQPALQSEPQTHASDSVSNEAGV